MRGIKIKKVFAWTGLLITLTLTGCSAKGMEEAYSIRETYGQDSDTKETGISVEKATKSSIDFNGAKILEPNDEMKYGQLSLKVKDFRRGSNINDLSGIMSEEEKTQFIKDIYSRSDDINSDGRFFSMDSADQCKLYFMKAEITNNSNTMCELYTKTVFYGVTQNKDKGKIACTVYDFSGEHYNSDKGMNKQAKYMHIEAGETVEVVYVLGLYKAENYDAFYNKNADYYTTLYLSSTSLDGIEHSGGSDLPAGSTLMKIMEGGKILYNE